jgi:HEAT repeat protein
LLALAARPAAGKGAPPPLAASPCGAAVLATVRDAAAPHDLRVLATDVLAAVWPDEARQLFKAALADADPTVRAAAIRLTARPHGGRPALYRTLPFVHDPAVEVRAAAAAALLRCCGDLALPELLLVFKESDPRPALAVADELGRLSTEASADFLARMAKRRDPAVRDAVGRALRARRDARAHAVLSSLERAGGPDGSYGTAPSSTAIFQSLLSGGHDRQAAEWIVAELERLDQRRKVEVLAAWLGRKAQSAIAPLSVR